MEGNFPPPPPPLSPQAVSHSRNNTSRRGSQISKTNAAQRNGVRVAHIGAGRLDSDEDEREAGERAEQHVLQHRGAPPPLRAGHVQVLDAAQLDREIDEQRARHEDGRHEAPVLGASVALRDVQREPAAGRKKNSSADQDLRLVHEEVGNDPTPQT